MAEGSRDWSPAIKGFVLTIGIALLAKYVVLPFVFFSSRALFVLDVINLCLTPFDALGEHSRTIHEGGWVEVTGRIPRFSDPWPLILGQWISLSFLHAALIYRLGIKQVELSSIAFVGIIGAITGALIWALDLPVMWSRIKM